VRGSPVTETCVKRGSNQGQGPIRFLLLYRGSSPLHTAPHTLRHQCRFCATSVNCQRNRLTLVTLPMQPQSRVLTCKEYRAVSGVFRTIYPPPPPHPASVSSSRTKGGGYTLAGRCGGGVSIFRKTPDIGLASYSIISLRMQPNMNL
jgi:hypothetical protein